MTKGVYMPRTWEPFIPGTEVSRAGFLITLRHIWDSPLSKYSAFFSETLRILTEPNVLNCAQICTLTGHNREYVYKVAELMNIKLPSTRAVFDPEMLPLMQTCLADLAQGKGIRHDQLEVLSMTVGPSLIEALLGVPEYTVWNAKARAKAKSRKLMKLETESW